MRADRLISLIVLLQSKHRLTAPQLALELEVSERTIYRDVEALIFAGVPIKVRRGKRGGLSLPDYYRTDLTGLNPDEIRALCMLNVPQALTDLGVGNELKAALRKLTAAITQHRNLEVSPNMQIHLDTKAWYQKQDHVPRLHTIYNAIRNTSKLYLKYQLFFGYEAERIVNPYGLVAKERQWYLVSEYKERMRVDRVSRITSTSIIDDTFECKPGFQLQTFWDKWVSEKEKGRPLFRTRVLISPKLYNILPRYFSLEEYQSDHVSNCDNPSEWIEIQMSFETFDQARQRILGMGGAIKVLEPQSLRKSINDFAKQVTALYTAS